MTSKELIKLFIHESYSKWPENIFPTNKTIVEGIEDPWSLRLLDSADYGPENNSGFHYHLVK